MQNEKEKYERLISASPLFSLDREKEATAYRREALKMVEYLYRYLMSINEQKYVEFGMEITETANRCISNFSTDTGEFLHYFNVAWAKEYLRAYARHSAEEMRAGIHIPVEDERNIRKYLKYAESHHADENSSEFVRNAADALDISEARVRELIRTIRDTAVISDRTTNEDGEEISLFDTIADETVDAISDEDNKRPLDDIEKVFVGLQDRQKPIVSAMMTAKVCKVVCELRIPIVEYTFIDQEIMKKYISTGDLPTQRDIAAQFGKNEASVSRTVKEFIEKIQDKR